VAADLSKLTKQQKLELLDLLELKAAHKRRAPLNYVPNSGQAVVHKSSKQLRFVLAGNGSGKSALGANEIKWAVEGYNPQTKAYTPVPCRAYVILDKPEKVDMVLLPELRKWMAIEPEYLHKRGKPYISLIQFPNGSSITPLFHEQDPLTAEGIEGDFFWFDEPPPRALFISLRRAGRTKGRPPRYLFTGTPISAPWLRTEIYEPWSKGQLPECECFRFGTAVNEANLIDGYIEQFGRLLTEKERRIRLEGEFFDLDGLALAHLFKQDVHIIDRFEWPADWPTVIAIDPHGSKPHHACLLGVDRDNHYFYIKEIREKVIARQFAKSIKGALMDGYRVVDIICDSSGSAESTGGEGYKSFIQILQDEGIRVRATSFDDKNDEDWMTRIQEALAIPDEPDGFGQRIPQLRIMRGNHGIVSDIENVQWTKVRNLDVLKPKLDISNKDFLACLKYALASNLHIDKGRGSMFVRAKAVTAYGQAPRTGRITISRRSKRAARNRSKSVGDSDGD
jgi:hypothetical protein